MNKLFCYTMSNYFQHKLILAYFATLCLPSTCPTAMASQKNLASLLAKRGLTLVDLHNYRTTSVEIILKIASTANVPLSHIARESSLHINRLRLHMRAKSILRDASISKLQIGMRKVIADVEFTGMDELYYHQLIDNLRNIVKVERVVLEIKKGVDDGKVELDKIDQSYLNEMLLIRKRAIKQPTKKPKVDETEEEYNRRKIAEVLQKYNLTVINFNSHRKSSSAILQKIIAAARTTYGSRFLKHNNVSLTAHFSGTETISDETVAKLKALVADKIIEAKVGKHEPEQIKRETDIIFQALDFALRVERAAQRLSRTPQLLNEKWTRRVDLVLKKRRGYVQKALTRNKTDWTKIVNYDISQQVVLVKIIDTLIAGGWLLPFSNMETHNITALQRLLSGHLHLSDRSITMIRDEIKKTLAQEPIPTRITKKATAEKLVALLSKLTQASRTDKLLTEMQKNIDKFNEDGTMHILKAAEFRNTSLIVTRFRVTWDDISAYHTSFAATLKEILTKLALSAQQASLQAGLAHNVVSSSLIRGKILEPKSSAQLIHFLHDASIAAGLPVEQRDKALDLYKLNRIEQAAREVLKKPELTSQLNREHEDMLRNVLMIKRESLGQF